MLYYFSEACNSINHINISFGYICPSVPVTVELIDYNSTRK